MARSIRRLAVAAALSYALLLPAAAAQTLARLAPPDAVLVFDFERPPDVDGNLYEALAALDWSAAGETLQTLGALLGDDLPGGPGLAATEAFRLLGSIDPIRAEIEAECPAVPSDLHPARLLDAGILTIGLSAASPFPVLTMIGRVPSDQASTAAELNAALVECYGSDQLVQGDTTMHILGQGSDLPVVIAQVDDLWIAATSPDAVRGVIRRSRGSDEPGWADTRLWTATERFEGTGLGLAVELAAAVDLVQGLTGRSPSSDTPEGYLRQRLLAAVKTLGGVAMRLGVDQDGLLLESAVAVDPAGGDDALADLLLCTTCGVTRPFLAPSGSNGLTSQHVPLREFVQYAQGWLDGVAEITGGDLDLRTLVQENLSADLDFALLDWLGTQVNIVTLDPFAPTLAQLVYQQPTALIVPVAGREAAELGLDTLATALAPVVAELFSSLGSVSSGMGGPTGLAALRGEASMYASRQHTYRDITYDRLQLGPTIDIAVAFVGNHLVIASPSHAIRPVIDTFRGDREMLSSAAYEQARDAAPATPTAIAFSDVGANLAGIARLGHVLAQPTAALISAAAAEAATDGERPGAASGPEGGLETTSSGSGVDTLRETAVFAHRDLPLSTSSSLSANGVNEFGEYADRYRLTGVPVGASVRVELRSDAFDTYLYLLGPMGDVLDANDDFGSGTDSALTITADGRDLLIDASSFGGDSTGPYTLILERGSADDLPRVDLSGAEAQPLDAPTSGTPVTVEAELSGDERLPGGDIGRYYALDGLSEGQLVEIALTSSAFDTYLRVVSPDTAAILAENDDSPDTSRSAVWFNAPGTPVWVQVTSWSGYSTGPFTLEVTERDPVPASRDQVRSPAEDRPEAPLTAGAAERGVAAEVDPPSFAALLELTELLPDAVAVLSEHIGLSIGYSYVDESTIYRRTLLEVDW